MSKVGLANVADYHAAAVMQQLFSPCFFPLLYPVAMFFCFFSKFRFIQKKCAAWLPITHFILLTTVEEGKVVYDKDVMCHTGLKYQF